MKILVKEKGKKKLSLHLPTRLIFAKTLWRIVKKATRHAFSENEQKSVPGVGFLGNVSERNLEDALSALKMMRKYHPGVPLVDIETADGDRVLIKL